MNPTLRIAQVAPLWTPVPPLTYGGIEVLMKLLIDGLATRGHEVTLFGPGDSRVERLRAVCERNLGDWFTEGHGWTYEAYVNSAVAEVIRAQAEFDVVHFHLPLAWVPLAATMKTPAVFTMHTAPIPDDEWVLRRWPAATVAGISRAQLHAASLRLGREFPVVYNAIDFDAFEPCYEAGRYLAFLGRMSPEKNPLDAIHIARATGHPLVLAGVPQNPKEHEYFETQVRPHIDGDQVRWIGPVTHPQKNELLRHAGALLFPIQWDEPFGLVMIEAMACGTPVLAHRRGSVEEVIDDGLTGCHTGAMDALADLVPRALALDRRAVREFARERFHIPRMVADYEALYRSLLPRRHPRPPRRVS